MYAKKCWNPSAATCWIFCTGQGVIDLPTLPLIDDTPRSESLNITWPPIHESTLSTGQCPDSTWYFSVPDFENYMIDDMSRSKSAGPLIITCVPIHESTLDFENHVIDDTFQIGISRTLNILPACRYMSQPCPDSTCFCKLYLSESRIAGFIFHILAHLFLFLTTHLYRNQPDGPIIITWPLIHESTLSTLHSPHTRVRAFRNANTRTKTLQAIWCKYIPWSMRESLQRGVETLCETENVSRRTIPCWALFAKSPITFPITGWQGLGGGFKIIGVH